MGLLTFGLNITLDGCYDHQAGIPDDEMLSYWTRIMDNAGAMLFGRKTYEMMECFWPAVAKNPKAKLADRKWAKKLDAKTKYVISRKRRDFSWENTHHLQGNLSRAVKALKRDTPRGILVGSPKLGFELLRFGLIDRYLLVIHPVIAGYGPYLFAGHRPSVRLKLIRTKRLKSGIVVLEYRER